MRVHIGCCNFITFFVSFRQVISLSFSCLIRGWRFWIIVIGGRGLICFMGLRGLVLFCLFFMILSLRFKAKAQLFCVCITQAHFKMLLNYSIRLLIFTFKDDFIAI